MDEDLRRDPIDLFREWLAEAERLEPNDPNAMALATADPAGLPSVRMVLLKGLDARGFVFFTNLDSQKGENLRNNPQAALCFHWKSLKRQVRISGPVDSVSDQEADDYFHSRPRTSQIGAWASQQSRPLEGRWMLERRVAEMTVKFGIGTIPRPPVWSGFRVVPVRVEFWRDRMFRLHDRFVFQRTAVDSGWAAQRLYP